jgi:hypothetical protein
MGLALSLPRKYFGGDQVTPAPRRVTVCNYMPGIASMAQVVKFRLADTNTRPKYTVRSQPLDHNEVARHFAKVTTRIEWPLEDSDTE